MGTTKEPLGARLRRLRLANGLTIQQIAKHLGVATSTYREWEYGRSIRGEPYAMLADIFDSTIYEILTGEKFNAGKIQVELDQIEYHVKSLRKELSKVL